MPSPTDFPTAGKVIEVKDDLVVFAPRPTRYQLHLKTPHKYAGLVNSPIDCLIRASARKVWTVPSGGNFITPIVGTPRIVQGRVRYADENQLVVHAGANFIIDLPAADAAIDLTEGSIALNTMVNVVLLPGASFELISAPQPVAATA